MNILRNDFMLDDNKKDKDVCLSQIEINTVAVSFGAACSKMTNLHTNILNYTNNQDFISKVSFVFLNFFHLKSLCRNTHVSFTSNQLMITSQF